MADVGGHRVALGHGYATHKHNDGTLRAASQHRSRNIILRNYLQVEFINKLRIGWTQNVVIGLVRLPLHRVQDGQPAETIADAIIPDRVFEIPRSAGDYGSRFLLSVAS